jgi:hypothetical protein
MIINIFSAEIDLWQIWSKNLSPIFNIELVTWILIIFF